MKNKKIIIKPFLETLPVPLAEPDSSPRAGELAILLHSGSTLVTR